MTESTTTQTEAARLAALQQYNILDTAPTASFDDLTHLAAQIWSAPIAMIGFACSERIWLKSKIGLDIADIPRDHPLYTTLFQSEGTFFGPAPAGDAQQDGADPPLGTFAPQFYAGAPLRTSEGHVLGMIGVMDHVARQPLPEQLTALQMLGRQVIDQLELRRHVAEQEHRITETLRAAETLQASEARYRLIAENATDLISRHTPDGVYLYASPASQAVLGYTPEELVGHTSEEFFHPDDRDEIRQSHTILMRSSGRVALVYRLRHKDGHWLWAETTAQVIRDPQTGAILELQCTTRDVTEHKHMDEALRESRQMLQLVMDHIPETVFWKDQNLNYLGCNRRFAEDAGFSSPEELIGMNDFQMPWADLAEQYRADDRLVIESDTPKLNFEEPIKKAGGTQGWLRTSKIPLHGPTGQVVAIVGMYEDITNDKRVQEERLRLQEERMHLQEQIIRAQEATLAELSTPLIPINDHVMVMPLIGAMDSRRAGQVIEELLKGIATHHAEVAILDITGVPVVDTQVANGLLRAAQAVKLLGAQVVLTGIRPEVAQTLVGLGTDLRGITTRSSLQSGIAFAMEQR